MANRIIVTLLVVTLAAFPQPSADAPEHNEEVEVAEARIRAAEISSKVSEAVDKALAEADIEDKIAKVEIHRELVGGFQCDIDDEDCRVETIRRWGRKSPACYSLGRPKGILALLCKFMGVLILLAMWVITLVVIGKGLGRIAKAIEHQNKH
ncbi:MAG TPA: hypothetical protein ENN07_00115 [candidate division Zixibacteria bacterium]|nr:hypothetical protein [candidate division Zixibacteria bacterium]